jgi:hypothetical protein
MAFERVFTVWDYYDGPRSGIAEFLGQPHYYVCEWNAALNDYAETFILTPVDDETLSLALEQWAIWQEWDSARHRGVVSQSTHPALPGVHPRYAELEALLKARISLPSTDSHRVRAIFQARSGQASTPPGVLRDLEVEWSEAKIS